MEGAYLVTPFLAWLLAGSMKFAINSIRCRRLAFGDVGYGGMPSNHSAIVSSTTALIALKEGVSHPAFGVALTVAFVVIMDAISLRRQVGKHAEAINNLVSESSGCRFLRERMGHTLPEVTFGIVAGIAIAVAVSKF